MTKLLPRILAVAGAAALILLGIEAYYRFVADRPDAFMVTRASERWFNRHYQRNSRGFRAAVEYANEPEAGKKRIVFLGDSPTAGHGISNIQDRFTDRIQVALGDQWEIHNLGVLGVDTQDESTLIQQMLKRGYLADEVVLVYSLDDLLTGVPILIESSNRLHAYFGHPGFWVAHSDWMEARALARFVAADSVLAHEDELVRAAYGAVDLVEVEKARVAKLRDILEAKNIAFSVVTFPSVRALGADYPFRDVHAQLERMWTELGVQHLDLLPTLEAHADRPLALSRGDPHPNALADSLAAVAILDFLPRARAASAAAAAAQKKAPAPPK